MNGKNRIAAFLTGVIACAAPGTVWSQSTPFGYGYQFSGFKLTSAEYSSSIAAEVGGGFAAMVSGAERPGSNAEVLLLRTTGEGEAVQGRRYLLRDRETYDVGELYGAGLVRSHDGRHVVVAGTALLDNRPGIWVAMIAADSMEPVWSRRLVSDEEQAQEWAAFLLPLRDGNYLVGGLVDYPSARPRQRHQYLASLSEQGEVLWARRYDRSLGVTMDQPTMALEADGLIYVTGLRDEQFPYVMGIEPSRGLLVSEALAAGVRLDTDIIVPETHYFSPSAPQRTVNGRPHLVHIREEGRYAIAYTLRNPGGSGGAIFFLNDELNADALRIYGETFGPGGTPPPVDLRFEGAQHLGPNLPAGDIIHLNTLDGDRSGFLELTRDGVPLSYHLYGYPFIQDASPISKVDGGYVFANVEYVSDKLWLSHTDHAGLGPCTVTPAPPIGFDEVDFANHVDSYASTPWGESQPFRVLTDRMDVQLSNC